MSELKKPKKIIFAPAFLEGLHKITADMSPEELKEFEDDLQKAFNEIRDGSFVEKSQIVDMDRLREEDPKLYNEIVTSLDGASKAGEPN